MLVKTGQNLSFSLLKFVSRIVSLLHILCKVVQMVQNTLNRIKWL